MASNKVKYAIYQGKIGKWFSEYADTQAGIKDFPYIKKEYLPVIINRVGGYTHFDLEIEKKKGFLKIVSVENGKDPLKLEEMFPKNSPDFEYGWISPDGDTYNTGYEGHSWSAIFLCKAYNYSDYRAERELEEKGWVKITGIHTNGELRKFIFVENSTITKKQADTLFDLGLYDDDYVQGYIARSECNW